MEQIEAGDIAQARDSLRRILDALASGELAGGGLLTRRLEGAVAAFEALCEAEEAIRQVAA